MKARIVRLACRIYAVMVRAYPSSFRREYSREMMLVFEDRARDVAERAGGWAVLPFMLHITCDWLLTMVREGVNLPIRDPTGVVLRTFLNCAIVVAWVQVSWAAYLWVAEMWLNARTPTSGLLFEFLVPFGAGLCLLWCVGGAVGGWIATRRAGRDRALIGVASALAQLPMTVWWSRSVWLTWYRQPNSIPSSMKIFVPNMMWMVIVLVGMPLCTLVCALRQEPTCNTMDR